MLPSLFILPPPPPSQKISPVLEFVPSLEATPIPRKPLKLHPNCQYQFATEKWGPDIGFDKLPQSDTAVAMETLSQGLPLAPRTLTGSGGEPIVAAWTAGEGGRKALIQHSNLDREPLWGLDVKYEGRAVGG